MVENDNCIPALTVFIAVPTTLVSNTYWTAADATVTRTSSVTDGTPGGPGSPGTPFSLDHTPFVLTNINKTVSLNGVEQWTVTNTNVFGHSFQIHDVEFKIISRSSGPVGAHESVWKDTYYLPVNESVTFVAKFEDYADALHPFMYHCHFAPHEDGGMMGQFVVTDPAGVAQTTKPDVDYTIYPNPVNGRLYVAFNDPAMTAYYVTITDAVGRTVYMLPRPQLADGIDMSRFKAGIYFIQLTDELTKKTTTKKFIKE